MNEIKSAIDDTLSNVSMTSQMKQRVLQATNRNVNPQHHMRKRPVIIAIMAAIMILGSATVIGGVNSGWLDEFTRWYTELAEEDQIPQRKFETTLDGVIIVSYSDRNQNFHFEFTNANVVTPVYQEDAIELQIEKQMGSTLELIIPAKDAFTKEAYEEINGEPVDGRITRSKTVTYKVINP